MLSSWLQWGLLARAEEGVSYHHWDKTVASSIMQHEIDKKNTKQESVHGKFLKLQIKDELYSERIKF